MVSLAALLLSCSLSSQAQSRYVSAIPLTPSTCEQARDLTRSGIEMSTAKHFSQAIKKFSLALAICPDDENTALDLLQATVDARDYGKTQSTAQAFLSHYPHSETGLVMLAYSYLMQGNSQDAGRTLQRVLTQNGKDPDALKLMGLTLFLYGEYAQAEQELSAALLLRPHDEKALYALGRVYETDNNFPPAIQCFEKLIAEDPTYYRAYVNLALCHQAQGNFDQAGELFKTAEQVAQKVNPNDDWAYADHADMLAKLGRNEEALQCIEKAAVINPRSARDQFIFGKVLLARDNPIGAEEHLRMSVKLDDSFPQSHYLLGRIYEKRNDRGRAQQEFALFQRLSEKAHRPGTRPLSGDTD